MLWKPIGALVFARCNPPSLCRPLWRPRVCNSAPSEQSEPCTERRARLFRDSSRVRGGPHRHCEVTPSTSSQLVGNPRNWGVSGGFYLGFIRKANYKRSFCSSSIQPVVEGIITTNYSVIIANSFVILTFITSFNFHVRNLLVRTNPTNHRVSLLTHYLFPQRQRHPPARCCL